HPSATTAASPLSLHDALPILQRVHLAALAHQRDRRLADLDAEDTPVGDVADQADLLETHRASSASSAAMTRSRISSTSIFSTSSDRKSTRLNSSRVKISYAVF